MPPIQPKLMPVQPALPIGRSPVVAPIVPRTRYTHGEVAHVDRPVLAGRTRPIRAVGRDVEIVVPTMTPPDRIRVDPLSYEVWIGPQLLQRRLSAQEFELVRYLYDRRDRVCKRQDLGDAVWGTARWDISMLHKLIHRLKNKIEPNPERPRYLLTVPWIGYRLLE